MPDNFQIQPIKIIIVYVALKRDRYMRPKPDDRIHKTIWWILLPEDRVNRKPDELIIYPVYHVHIVETMRLLWSKLDRILGSRQYYLVLCFFAFSVLCRLVFYLFGPLDSVYNTSSMIEKNRNFKIKTNKNTIAQIKITETG